MKQLASQPDKQAGPHNRNHNRGKQAMRIKANGIEHKAADKGADDADYNVLQQTAGDIHNVAGDSPGQCTNNQGIKHGNSFLPTMGKTTFF